MPISPRFDRADIESARRVTQKLLPDRKVRRLVLELLKRGIEGAQNQNSACWGVTLSPARLRLNVGRGAVFSLEFNALELKNVGTFSSDELEEQQPQLIEKWEAVVQNAARDFEQMRISNPSWRSAHSSGVLELLRDEFNTEIPDPSYFSTPKFSSSQPFDLKTHLISGLKGAGLHLDETFVAAFFTALQTKGFVVLSGLSGTGKTQLATTFAALLPQPSSNEEIAVFDAAFAVNGRLVLPPNAARLISDGPLSLNCEGRHFKTKSNDGALVLRGPAKTAALQMANGSSQIGVEGEIDDAGHISFRLLPLAPTTAPSNHLFLSVRPDWSDSKSLLGYFNPLLSRYEWTPFLRFLLRAKASFEAQDGIAYFVILDEMNLARAEHYFADLLSVLESGRDHLGQTREPIRFDYDPRASGELPPKELFLPPNLYFIGTLNSDETTFALSPKVLDRAWILDSPRVDFSGYLQSSAPEKPAISSRELGDQFARNGVFIYWNQEWVRAELEIEPKWRDWLQDLNEKLQSVGSGFGFRIFDEIVAFCALSRQNRLFESSEIAFDWAVVAKVLPKLNGNRMQSEETLEILGDWAKNRGLNECAKAAKNRLEKLERDGWI